MEFYSVMHDEAQLLKKIARVAKRKNLKRKKVATDQDVDVNEDDELPIEIKVDKTQIKDQIQSRDYDLT